MTKICFINLPVCVSVELYLNKEVIYDLACQ